MTPAQLKIKAWRRDANLFATECLGLSLDEWQIEALKALGGDNNPRRRICMKACTGPGKSFVLAIAGWHRLACFASKGDHPKGAAISGEGKDNLKDNLWAELSKVQQRSEFLKAAFTWTKERIYANDHPETWFLSARSYAKDADSEAIGRSLSGLHSPYPFILLDEIGDMPPTVGQKATQIFTGGVVDGLIMGAGNPTSHSGLLYQISTLGLQQWVLITITADPEDSKRTPRVDVEHAREQIALYGKDNPWVMSTILGLFPPNSINALLGPDEVQASMKRHYKADMYSFSQKRLGIDCARFGDDRTVIAPRQGLVCFKPVVLRNARQTDIAARTIAAKVKWGAELEFVDGTGGYGAGVIDFLIQGGFSPHEINFSGKAIDPRYFNKRSEIHFLFAEWVKRGGALPNDPELARELTAPTYTFQNGKLRVEEKDQIKKRLGFSPDKSDAYALTFSLPDMPAAHPLEDLMKDTKHKWEYDPLNPEI